MCSRSRADWLRPRTQASESLKGRNGNHGKSNRRERSRGGLKKSSSTTPSDVQQLVAKARVAQAAFEAFSQEQVDAIVRDFGKHVYDNAETIADAAHKETGLGVYEDKVAKAKGKARVIWNNLKGKKSRGIIGEDTEANLVLVAKPMGVVAAVCPVTNPVVTPMACDVRSQDRQRS